MEKLKGSPMISPKDIAIITGKHYRNAWTEHRSTRDALNKKKGKLTVTDYCKFYDLDFNEVVSALNSYR